MPRARRLTARADIRSTARDISELVELAGAKDIDVAVMCGEALCRTLGIPETAVTALADARAFIRNNF